MHNKLKFEHRMRNRLGVFVLLRMGRSDLIRAVGSQHTVSGDTGVVRAVRGPCGLSARWMFFLSE